MEIYITTATARGYESLQRYVLSLNGTWEDGERDVQSMDDEDRGIVVSSYEDSLYMNYFDEEDMEYNHMDFNWEQEGRHARAAIRSAQKEAFPEGISYEDKFITIIEDPETEFTYGMHDILPI